MAKAETPRIWYAMPFKDELDMLTCQLIEHADRVHKFVLTEATVDHAGQPKPLWIQRYWDSFSPWHDKIEYLVDGGEPTFEQNANYWVREQQQRSYCMPYLESACADDDVVVVSDIDEFVPPLSLERLPAPTLGFMQKLRYAAVDWDGSPGVTAVSARAGLLRSGVFTTDVLRQRRQEFMVAEDGGYHFSWFGGPERIEAKAICSPHQESLEANLELARGGYAWQRGMGSVGPGVGNVAMIEADYPVWVQRRECPWYWWRPDGDNLPADPVARGREISRRRLPVDGLTLCAQRRDVMWAPPAPGDVSGGSAWHRDDGTPCPSAALEVWR